MKKQPRKLALKTDTVRKLEVAELSHIAGGYGDSHNRCDPPGSTRTDAI